MLNLLKPPLPSLFGNLPPRSFEISPPPLPLSPGSRPPRSRSNLFRSPPSFPSLPPSPPAPPQKKNLRPSCQICPDLFSRSSPPKKKNNLPPTSFARADNLAIYKAFQSGSKLQGLAGMPPGRDWGRRRIHGAPTPPPLPLHALPPRPRPLYPRPPFQKKRFVQNVSFKKFLGPKPSKRSRLESPRGSVKQFGGLTWLRAN